MACNTVKKGNEGQNLNRVWMLVAFNSFEKEYLIKKEAYLDLTQPSTASSKMGCNLMSFPYKIKGDTEISFLDGVSTEMHCPDMKLEKEFSKIITSAKSYSIDGHKLVLTTQNGSKISFVAQDWD